MSVATLMAEAKGSDPGRVEHNGSRGSSIHRAQPSASRAIDRISQCLQDSWEIVSIVPSFRIPAFSTEGSALRTRAILVLWSIDLYVDDCDLSAVPCLSGSGRTLSSSMGKQKISTECCTQASFLRAHVSAMCGSGTARPANPHDLVRRRRLEAD